MTTMCFFIRPSIYDVKRYGYSQVKDLKIGG